MHASLDAVANYFEVPNNEKWWSFANSTEPSVIFLHDGQLYSQAPPPSPDVVAFLHSPPHVGIVQLPAEGWSGLWSIVHFVLQQFCLSTVHKGQNIQLARTKLAELELALQALMKHTDIPAVFLSVKEGILPTDGDSNRLNELQAVAQTWKKQLQSLASVDSPEIRNPADELGWWVAVSAALDQAVAQMNSPEVEQVLAELEKYKRYIHLRTDSGIAQSQQKVVGYLSLLRDLGLEFVSSASTPAELIEALDTVFDHLHRRLRPSGYPVVRAIELVGAIGRVACESLLKYLRYYELLTCPPETLRNIWETVEDLQTNWEGHSRDFSSMARDVMRRRSERYVPVRIEPAFREIHAGVAYLVRLRDQHDSLITAVPSAELSHAWDLLTKVDPLSNSPEWTPLEQSYQLKAEQAERKFALELKAELDNTTDIFDVFRKHRTVLSRPAVRAAVAEYENHLVAEVQRDVQSLQIRVARDISDAHGVSGVVWAKQISQRLAYLLSKLEDILGRDWTQFAAAQTLVETSESLQKQLSTTRLIEEWSESAVPLKGPVLIVKQGKILLNCPDKIVKLPSDLRALRALGEHVPATTAQIVRSMEWAPPVITQIQDALLTIQSMRLKGRAGLLSYDVMNSCLQLLEAGFSIEWESVGDLEAWVIELSDHTSKLIYRNRSAEELDGKVRNAPPSQALEVATHAVGWSNYELYVGRVQADIRDRLAVEAVKKLQSWLPTRKHHTLLSLGQLDPSLASSRSEWIQELSSMVPFDEYVDSSVVFAFAGCLKKVIEWINEATKFVEEWQGYRRVMAGPPPKLPLDAALNLRQQLQQPPPVKFVTDTLVIDATIVQPSVAARCDLWRADISRFVSENGMQQAQELLEVLGNGILALSNVGWTSIHSIAKVLDILKLDPQIEVYCTAVPLIAPRLIENHRRFINLRGATVKRLESERPQISRLLQSAIRSYTNEVNNIEREWPFAGTNELPRLVELLQSLMETNSLSIVAAWLGLEVPSPRLSSLESLWTNWQPLWQRYQTLNKTAWAEVEPTKLRRDLYSLTRDISGLAPKLASHRAVKELKEKVIHCQDNFALITLLKSQALLPKHFAEMGLAEPRTVGDAWSFEKNRLEKLVKQAEGEASLRSYIAKIDDYWRSGTLERLAHRKTWLICNLPQLFTTVEEHRAALKAMRRSPHFDAVAAEVNEWDQRLINLRQVFEVWGEVQSAWVGLAAIFDSDELCAILPAESARFRAISGDTEHIFELSVHPPLTLASEPQLSKKLSNISTVLQDVYRSLSHFLEEQRQAFPRLYFLGDEDLLAALGGSLPPLDAVFGGVNSLEIVENMVKGVRSTEGELLTFNNDLPFNNPIATLCSVETEIEQALKREIRDAYDRFDEEFPLYPVDRPLQAMVVSIRARSPDGSLRAKVMERLTMLALKELSFLERRRVEVLINEISHDSEFSYSFINDQLVVSHLGVEFEYGWEWWGTPEPLVDTPLTDRFYLTAMQALNRGLGVAPKGPAGTGKTESVKALGRALGRRVAVFCCDESFDFNALVRLLEGVAKTNSWGCFDEFNRLEPRVLSAVATEIAARSTLPLFVTMNPGYKGRHELPANLSGLFRTFAMAKPDSRRIVEVLLLTLGFKSDLSLKLVNFVEKLSRELSHHDHYDWGLRALKGVLRVCGILRRDFNHDNEDVLVGQACRFVIEPRLVGSDINLFLEELSQHWGSIDIANDTNLMTLAAAEGLSGPEWLDKAGQFSRFIDLFSGVMIVGPPAAGKSAAIRAVASLRKASIHRIDPQTLSKAELYGRLDATTREWTDGLVPFLLRKCSTLEGLQFLVFDGVVEPGWAEILNSVLDDNRFLSLPTGERVMLPPNVRIVIETEGLQSATPATVSRCGMIWFPERSTGFNKDWIDEALRLEHALPFSEARCKASFEAYTEAGSPDAAIWALAGDSPFQDRVSLSERLFGRSLELPAVEPVNLDASAVVRSDLVVPTPVTEVHEKLLHDMLRTGRPLLLAGPPGAGKTMTLLAALRRSALGVISLNFSQTATQELVIAALEMHCRYVQPDILEAPQESVLFVDELNLVSEDSGAIAILRSLIEQGGFLRKGRFVEVRNVQLVAALNPSLEGRHPMNVRLLRHFAVIYVELPSPETLVTIYTPILSGILHLSGNESLASTVAAAMVKVYERSKQHFQREIYSPRELTRWCRGLYEHLVLSPQTPLGDIWAYEALRLFSDRLRSSESKNWTLELVSKEWTLSTLPSEIPVFCNWIAKRPVATTTVELRKFMNQRLRLFAEEGGSLLAPNDAFTEHALRVDRVLRQPQGHLMLVGPPGAGKKSTVRFVCWLNGVSVRQVRTWKGYGLDDFDTDLRQAIKVALRQPVCLIMDESTLLHTAFVERMNTLLANGEVPGLFDHPEERAALARLSPHEDMWKWLTRQIVNNLHVVFSCRSIDYVSGALINRCVLNWMEWSDETLKQVASNWTSRTDFRQSDIFVAIHPPEESPLAFIELCHQFFEIYRGKMQLLEDRQRHLLGGGDKLKVTVLDIKKRRRELEGQTSQLEAKEVESQQVLQDLISGQTEAERKKAAGVEIQAAIIKQRQEVADREQAVRVDLTEALPLVQQASRGVQDIKKSQLNELRALQNPPEPVKCTLEAVCELLGFTIQGRNWREILSIVRSDAFIPRIVQFDHATSDSSRVLALIGDLTVERVDRASKACGPLLQWVKAQLAVAAARKRVAPLEREVQELSQQLAERTAQQKAITEMLDELSEQLVERQRQYAAVISECESLKKEMAIVRRSVQSSEELLANFSDEQRRWGDNAREFTSRRNLLGPQCLVAAAFVAYCGALDPHARRIRLQSWCELCGIDNTFDPAAFLEYSDDNAAIEALSDRVVLRVDPEKAHPYDEMLSSDDPQLSRYVEHALRFGHRIVVSLVQSEIDPSLIPILTRDFSYKGYRLTVDLPRIGECDVSEGFELRLYTSNPTTKIENATVVDYSVTESALSELALARLLLQKRPDLAKRKTELRLLQSSADSRLQRLEEELLSALNGTQSVIDDPTVLESLKTLKEEATTVDSTRTSALEALKELDDVSRELKVEADEAARVWICLKRLGSVNPFYRFSLNFFWSCFGLDMPVKQMVWSAAAPGIRRKDRNQFANDLQVPVTAPIMQWSEILPSEPIATFLALGGDPTIRIEQLLPQDSCKTISLGVKEAVLATETSTAGWLVIQNIELAPEEWRPPQTGKHTLLITHSPDISWGRPLVCEKPEGFAAQLEAAVQAVSKSYPEELAARVCWLHAKLNSEGYEYSDADLTFALSLAKGNDPLKMLLTAVYEAPLASTDEFVRRVAEQAFSLDLQSIDDLEEWSHSFN